MKYDFIHYTGNIAYRSIKGTNTEGVICQQIWVFIDAKQYKYKMCDMPALYLVSQKNNIVDFPTCRQCLESFIGEIK